MSHLFAPLWVWLTTAGGLLAGAITWVIKHPDKLPNFLGTYKDWLEIKKLKRETEKLTRETEKLTREAEKEQSLIRPPTDAEIHWYGKTGVRIFRKVQEQVEARRDIQYGCLLLVLLLGGVIVFLLKLIGG